MVWKSLILFKKFLIIICLLFLSNRQITAQGKTTADIVEDVSASVVVIAAKFPNISDKGQGSGVIIDDGMTVVTNVHVVGGASEIMVHLQDGRSVKSKGYLKADIDRDLITIKIPKKFKGIKPIKLSRSKKIKIGTKVVAIGSPQGLTNTVSEGIISGMREFESGTKVIQTSAPVSPGSSGGGLFNLNSELIGITSFLHMGGQNLNFAYPAEYILPLLVNVSTTPFYTIKAPRALISTEGQNVYVTRTGKKYHRITCKYLRTSIRELNLSGAIEGGYTPCSVCRPIK